MIKLYKARSLLYRRQILQENIRWKALDEIYKIYMLLHRSDLNISEIFVKLFRIFWQSFAKVRYFMTPATPDCEGVPPPPDPHSSICQQLVGGGSPPGSPAAGSASNCWGGVPPPHPLGSPAAAAHFH